MSSPINLAIVRHGQSEWNELGLWTGWTDVDLTELGRAQARQAGESLNDIDFRYGFTSELIRARHTLDEIVGVLGGSAMELVYDKALNERNYGDYTGKNKWELRDQLREQQFNRIRRGWSEPIPNGETLEDVYQRAVPFYRQRILPHLVDGQNVLTVSSGNTIRAIAKYLESIDDDQISELEIGVGEIWLYEVDTNGKSTSKTVLNRTEAP